MPFFEVTKTWSETVHVEADDPRAALTRARTAEGSWERYKWSESAVDYDVCELSPEQVAELLEDDEVEIVS